MTKKQITAEAIKRCSLIDFSDDKHLNKKGRQKVREWAKCDFIDGAEWMQEQLRLSSVSQQRELLIAYEEYTHKQNNNLETDKLVDGFIKSNL